MKSKFTFCLSLFFVLVIKHSNAQSCSMVHEIYHTSNAAVQHLCNVNGTLFFFANDSINGQELWKSDGTYAGTMMVKDIYPGHTGSMPLSLFNYNGKCVFTASDSIHGIELWISDGTAAGTFILNDINAGTGNSFIGAPYYAIMGGELYFTNETTGSEAQLWKTDGTAIGTVMVKNSTLNVFAFLTTVGNVLVFSDSYGKLWSSDGTTVGTSSFVTGLWTGGLSNAILYNGNFCFIPDVLSNGYKLFKSDGTAPGTTLIKTINPTIGSYFNNMCIANNLLFLNANDSVNGAVLWKSDGTTPGTALVLAAASNPLGMVDDGIGKLIFSIGGQQLWKSDGTAGGTSAISTVPTNSSYKIAINGTVYLGAGGIGNGVEVWRSDETASGTAELCDIIPGGTGSAPKEFTYVNGKLFFRAGDGTIWVELYSLIPTLGINNEIANTIFNIYPNPSTGTVQVDLGEMNYSSIKIYNIVGEVVYTGTSNGNTIEYLDLSHLSNGTYMVQINDGKPQTRKLIIQK